MQLLTLDRYSLVPPFFPPFQSKQLPGFEISGRKGRIQANLKSRELFETISTEYEKSLAELLPLKERLRKTDRLIDQVVYKLYGLTEEEIRIAEGRR